MERAVSSSHSCYRDRGRTGPPGLDSRSWVSKQGTVLPLASTILTGDGDPIRGERRAHPQGAANTGDSEDPVCTVPQVLGRR